MEIRKQDFLTIVAKTKRLNHAAGQNSKVSKEAIKKGTSFKMYDRTSQKLTDFCEKNGLEKNAVLESLVELLPYIDLF
ncbi:MAG: hypothetical protein ACRC0Y_08960 [Fusobacteriaceae bacterium]